MFSASVDADNLISLHFSDVILATKVIIRLDITGKATTKNLGRAVAASGLSG